jgi:hypothetical protein
VRNGSVVIISGVIVAVSALAPEAQLVSPALLAAVARAPAGQATPGEALGQSSDTPTLQPAPVKPVPSMKPGPADQTEARFRISQMERLLEGAVEHGAKLIHQRLQAIVPAEMLVGENARARGFRLDGYGVFFDVEVPTMQASILASLRTLDQNDLGLDTAFRTLKDYVDRARDTNVQQALRRIELQLAPINAALGLSPQALPNQRPAGPASTVADQRTSSDPTLKDPIKDPILKDPILKDPNEAYRSEVQQQIMDTMLDSAQIAIGPDEWLTVGARRRDNDRPVFAPADTDAGTMVIRIRGRDLAALRAGRLSRDEALKTMDVRVF